MSEINLIAAVEFTNIIVYEKNHVLLQYRVPQDGEKCVFPYHFSTWGGARTSQDNTLREGAFRELSEELKLQKIPANIDIDDLKYIGQFFMPLPTNPAGTNTERFIEQGHTRWDNHIYAIQLPLTEILHGRPTVGNLYKVEESWARAVHVDSLADLERPCMSTYDKIIRHIIKNEPCEKIVYEE